MNFAQRLGLFCLIVISVAYVYFSFFDKEGFKFNFNFSNVNESGNLTYDPKWQSENEPQERTDEAKTVKTVKLPRRL